jgi:hypothetical protein
MRLDQPFEILVFRKERIMLAREAADGEEQRAR